MPLEENNLGWFYIGEEWHLYVDGKLTDVYVEHICIDEAADGDGYLVDHYDRFGRLIKTERLYAYEIRSVVDNREPADRPMHI